MSKEMTFRKEKEEREKVKATRKFKVREKVRGYAEER